MVSSSVSSCDANVSNSKAVFFVLFAFLPFFKLIVSFALSLSSSSTKSLFTLRFRFEVVLTSPAVETEPEEEALITELRSAIEIEDFSAIETDTGPHRLQDPTRIRGSKVNQSQRLS